MNMWKILFDAAPNIGLYLAAIIAILVIIAFTLYKLLGPLLADTINSVILR